jgi:hypothetical protein
MAQIEDKPYGHNVENPPTRFISHKISNHILPPVLNHILSLEQMSYGVHQRDPYEMNNPPEGSQKTNPHRKIFLLQRSHLLRTLSNRTFLTVRQILTMSPLWSLGVTFSWVLVHR